MKWYIVAPDGDGPQISCAAAVVIARGLARGEMQRRGATPCLELITVDEFMAALAGFNVYETAMTDPGAQRRNGSALRGYPRAVRATAADTSFHATKGELDDCKR